MGESSTDTEDGSTPPEDVDAARSGDGAPEVGLSFVDLLYAVPVADLAMRVAATHLQRVTASGWMDIVLALAAITFGWVGHHTNRQQLPAQLKHLRRSREPFLQLRFLQFLAEIAIIIAYFALGTRAALPGVALSEVWKAEWLAAIFGLYVIWDLLDVWITHREKERRQTLGEQVPSLTAWATGARRGMGVTAFFFLAFVGVWLVARSGRHHKLHSVVMFDLLALVVLYLYRVIQERIVVRGWKGAFDKIVCHPDD